MPYWMRSRRGGAFAERLRVVMELEFPAERVHPTPARSPRLCSSRSSPRRRLLERADGPIR
jgi:hypothetical protein